MTLRVVSYGGGVQSTALLVLAAQGYVDFPTFLFANVGDDSEHPDTLAYVREVAFDYAGAHGIDMHELRRIGQSGRFAGKEYSLWEALMHPDSRSLPIPIRMSETGAPGTRNCTMEWKIKVVRRWVKAHGATADDPATVAIGFSTDEWTRANNRRSDPAEVAAFPLLDVEWHGRVGLSRQDCVEVIRSAGLPIPRKSACFFCPFHTPQVFRDQARDEPELFARSVLLEETLNQRRDALGKDHVYLTRYSRPLAEVVAGAGRQDELTGFDEDEGYRCGDVCDT